MNRITYCENCDGRTNRPGLHGCEDPVHPRPRLSQAIVWAVEAELSSRKHMGWDSLDRDVADELRDKLTNVVIDTIINRI